MSWAARNRADPYGMLRAGAPAPPRRTKPSAKALTTLQTAIKDLQKETHHQADVEAEIGKTTQYLCMQVQALQRGFLALSDAVIDELGSVEEERKSWTSTLASLRQEMSSKLREMEQWKDDLRSLTQRAVADTQASVKSSADQLEARFQDLRTDLKDQIAAVDRAAADKTELVQRRVQRHVDQAVPSLVEDMLASHLPGYLQQMQADLDAARRETQTATSLSASIAKSNSSLAEDVRNLHSWCQALEGSRAAQDSCVAQLESKPATSNSGIDALNDKVKQQSRHSQSLEDIVRALVLDTAALAKQTRSLDSHIHKVTRSNGKLQDALERSCFVFSSTLGIPPPIPLTSSGRLAT
ncbi:hypothetical protein WJX72_004082 [[Myrmecia] bisecta]|uniref:Uncharacterized protein n=1 Tax=[Myrmecia] bisecta TaxID=41462 RepID=A0AAW1R6N7_9CHLO